MGVTWRLSGVLFAAVSLLVVTGGCPARPLEEPTKNPTVENPLYFPQSIEKDIDLLFMIDNSNSMEPKQKNLADNFPRFIEALRSTKLGPVAAGAPCDANNRSGCKIPNVRIGVVSCDLGAGNYSFETCETPGGDRGRLVHAGTTVSHQSLAPPGCPLPKDPWIMYTDGPTGAVTNVQGGTAADPVQQVKDAFTCVAYLGAGGCGFEHQLESPLRALDGCQYTNGDDGQGNAKCKTNPGFIRNNAFLAVILLTDEDDCSARRTDLFDPSQQGLNDPLGPLASFRCTEFGIVCAEKMRQPGIKHNCVPGLDWLYDVSRYTDGFKAMKPPGRVILFAIVAPPEPVEVGLDGQNPTLKHSCTGINGIAGDPAVRIATVVKSFGPQGHFNEGIDNAGQKVDVNICSADYSPALKLLGQLIVASLGGQCISSPPLTKGGGIACRAGDDLGGGKKCVASCLDKVDCVVDERVGTAAPTPINKCPSELFDPSVPQNKCGTSCPCWRIIPNADCQAARDGSPYGLQIMRTGEATKGAVAEARCATSLATWGSSDFLTLPQCT